MSLTMLFTMIVCFALSVSIAVSIGMAASLVGMQTNNDSNMLISVKEIFNSLNKFPLAAIPFFILAGNMMECGGISAAWSISRSRWSAASRVACR
jgi:C4-dicarboxylate transporter DctM subunit